jgi:hypothetical protein
VRQCVEAHNITVVILVSLSNSDAVKSLIRRGTIKDSAIW